MTSFKDYSSTRILRCTLGSLALAICAGAWSQTLQPLTLSETLKLAANQSRQLAAQDAAVAAARQMSVSAGQLPDPVLRFGVDNLPVNGPDRFSTTADFMTMRRVGVMQELTRGEKRRLKSERSGHEAERELANRRNVLANVQRDTALAWLDRYYVERMRTVLGTLAEETRASIEAAEAAYRGGRGTLVRVGGLDHFYGGA